MILVSKTSQDGIKRKLPDIIRKQQRTLNLTYKICNEATTVSMIKLHNIFLLEIPPNLSKIKWEGEGDRSETKDDFINQSETKEDSINQWHFADGVFIEMLASF
jgi:hypothetical protein